MTSPKKQRKIINLILAIILAVGVWLYVINVENPTSPTTVRDIPITIVGQEELTDRGLMVIQLSEDSVDLRISGRKKTLMNLNRSNITLELDVSTITTEGEHTLSCRYDFPSNVGSDSVSISDWDDLRVTVTVARQETKEIPVRGEFIGTEAENCLAGTVTTNPDTVEVTGPAETLEGISYALASVGGKEISSTLTETTSVVLMGEDGTPADRQNVTVSTETVEVTVPVRQVVSIPLTVDLIDGGGATAADVNVAISPAIVTVTAETEGDVTLPDSISLGEIDLSNVLGNTSFSLPITLPEGVTLWGSQPSVATVSLTFPNITARQVAVQNIILENVPQGYEAELINQQLYVWVRGNSDLVADLDPGQLQVEVDLSDASTGSELQRFAATVTFKGDNPEGVGIMGTQYSVAVRLHPTS